MGLNKLGTKLLLLLEAQGAGNTSVWFFMNNALEIAVDVLHYGNNHIIFKCNMLVISVIKMGNIVPRAGIKCTSLAFWASVLPEAP